jgi:hypothetical protein
MSIRNNLDLVFVIVLLCICAGVLGWGFLE